MNFTIVVAAFSRPHALKRLLGSLERLDSNQQVRLVISIDGGGDPEVTDVAKDFRWAVGEKLVIQHERNLGLRDHILSCGDLTEKFGNVVILEDDLYASRHFLSYLTGATSVYSDAESVAGISLYSHSYNETAQLPFLPIHDGYDVFFLQLASSCGQAWTYNQWATFRRWYEDNRDNPGMAIKAPPDVQDWHGESSWKKYFNYYLIDKNKYFVYPRIGFTTHFTGPGTHFLRPSHVHQVPILYNENVKYHFSSIKQSLSVYDSFCEIKASCLIRLNPKLTEGDFSIDLYGMKPLEAIDGQSLFTSRKVRNWKRSFGRDLIPHEANLIAGISGDKIVFCDKEDVKEYDDFREHRFQILSDVENLLYYYQLTPMHFGGIESVAIEKNLTFRRLIGRRLPESIKQPIRAIRRSIGLI